MDYRREFAAAAQDLKASAAGEIFGLPSENYVGAGAEEQAADLVSFDAAASVAMFKFGIKPYVIAQTPTDAAQLIQLGVEPDRLIGLLWAGLGEDDYLKVNAGIAAFISGDPSTADWKPAVFGMIQQWIGPDRQVTPIFDGTNLMPALQGLGVAEPVMQQVFQAMADAERTLAEMK